MAGMTNYEWIHTLSIEELSEAGIITACPFCAYLTEGCRRGECCEEGHRLWLEQEHCTGERR